MRSGRRNRADNGEAPRFRAASITAHNSLLAVAFGYGRYMQSSPFSLVSPARCSFLRRLSTAALTALLALAGATTAAAQSAPDGSTTDALAPAEKKTLLIMNFTIKGDVDPGIASTVNDILASSMVRTGRFKVMTGDDIQSLMALEAGKQATGCESESCLAEIAGALGAELVVTGRVGRLGSLYVVKLSLIEPASASTLGLETLEAESVEDFAKRLRPLSKRFAALAYGETYTEEAAKPPVAQAPTTPAPAAEESEGGLGTMLLIGGSVIGGGALVTAVAAGAFATVGLIAVNDATTAGTDKELHRNLGPTLLSVAAAAGAIAVVGGGIAAAGIFVE